MLYLFAHSKAKGKSFISSQSMMTANNLERTITSFSNDVVVLLSLTVFVQDTEVAGNN